MGYTHYWSHGPVAPAAWAALVADSQKIIEAVDVPLRSYDGETGKPEFSAEEISFNGADDDSCESFVLEAKGTGFTFCKTARQPYDLVVCAVLLRAVAHIPGFSLRSDGDWYTEDEWIAARKLVARMFGWAPENSQFSVRE
jgi:hypothetical protein